jgi:hypothetical protein
MPGLRSDGVSQRRLRTAAHEARPEAGNGRRSPNSRPGGAKSYGIEMAAHVPGFDQFRKNAAECLRLAEGARNPAQRSYFMEMADRWLTLAEDARKTREE